MASIMVGVGQNRELLSRAIVRALQSWPDLHRKVFVRSHYSGDSPEAIARSSGRTTGEVRWILEECDRWLKEALHELRTGCAEGQSSGFRSSSSAQSVFG